MINNVQQKINKWIFPILLSLPDTEKQDYYKTRKTFVIPNELPILNYIQNNIDHNMSVCEVGCGYGQYLFILCALGYHCEGIESSRVDGLTKIQRDLSIFDSSFTNLLIHQGLYPNVMPIKRDVLLFNNIISTDSCKLETKIIQTFSKFKIVLLNSRVFTQYRETPTEREILLNTISANVKCQTSRLDDYYYRLDINN